MQTHLELRRLRPATFSFALSAVMAMSTGACEQPNSGAVPDKYMLAEESSEAEDAEPAKPSSTLPATPEATTSTSDAAMPALRSVVGALGIGVSDLKRSTDFYTR